MENEQQCTEEQLEKCKNNTEDIDCEACQVTHVEDTECPIGHKLVDNTCMQLLMPLCRPSDWESGMCWKHLK